MPTLLYQQSNVEVFWDEKERWLHVKWIGSPSVIEFQRDCEQILRLLAAKNADSLLNDNSRADGSWLAVAEWTEKDWFPRMRGAGLRYCAWVDAPAHPTPLPFNILPPGTRAFQSLQDAGNWLRIQRRRDAAKTQRIVLPPELRKR